MEEILHHLGCINLVNNGINYQPQLRISAINSGLRNKNTSIPRNERNFYLGSLYPQIQTRRIPTSLYWIYSQPELVSCHPWRMLFPNHSQKDWFGMVCNWMESLWSNWFHELEVTKGSFIPAEWHRTKSNIFTKCFTSHCLYTWKLDDHCCHGKRRWYDVFSNRKTKDMAVVQVCLV